MYKHLQQYILIVWLDWIKQKWEVSEKTYIVKIFGVEREGERRERERGTSLLAAMVSTIFFVNVLPTPEVPMRTVGFITWNLEMNVFHVTSRISLLVIVIHTPHLNCIEQFFNWFVLVGPRHFEMLKGLFTRANNQTLPYKIKTHNYLFAILIESNIVLEQKYASSFFFYIFFSKKCTLESTSQIFFLASSTGVFVYKTRSDDLMTKTRASKAIRVGRMVKQVVTLLDISSAMSSAMPVPAFH